MSERNIGVTVRSSMGVAGAQTLSQGEEAQLQSLEQIQDEDIDYSDIPRTPAGTVWTRPGLLGGSIGEPRRAAMREKLLLLDEDVVDLFRQLGENRPERMNRVLREYAEAHRKPA